MATPRRNTGGVSRSPAAIAPTSGVGAFLVGEAGARRAQHEPGHPVWMTATGEQGDRAAHRVAGSDEPFDPDDVGQRHKVVGAVLQPKPARAANAPTVTAVIDLQDMEPRAERPGGARPVQRSCRAETVEQEHRRRAVRARCVPHEHRTATGKAHELSRGHRHKLAIAALGISA